MSRPSTFQVVAPRSSQPQTTPDEKRRFHHEKKDHHFGRRSVVFSTYDTRVYVLGLPVLRIDQGKTTKYSRKPSKRSHLGNTNQWRGSGVVVSLKPHCVCKFCIVSDGDDDISKDQKRTYMKNRNQGRPEKTRVVIFE